MASEEFCVLCQGAAPPALVSSSADSRVISPARVAARVKVNPAGAGRVVELDKGWKLELT